MRIWPRRKPEPPPPPVVLPSLDRLAGLIERVVELVDEVSGGPAAAPQQRPAREQPVLSAPPAAPAAEPEPEPPAPAAAGGWVAFVPSPQGYELVDRNGTLPAPGDEIDVDGVGYRVLRFAPSPLPGDGRPCAVIEMEERPQPERTPDA
jgi:hypothetical protein